MGQQVQFRAILMPRRPYSNVAVLSAVPELSLSICSGIRYYSAIPYHQYPRLDQADQTKGHLIFKGPTRAIRLCRAISGLE